MKKFIYLIILFITLLLTGCNSVVYIEVNDDVNRIFEVGTTDVDFTEYFRISTLFGEEIEVTEDMLNLSRVDFSKPGKFFVTINYQDNGKSVEIIVVGEPINNINYNPNTVSKDRLQDVLAREDGAIGLPSIGTYNCLVVPIQFKNTTITNKDLEKLNRAFNGDDTGWESVSSYYKKSSYNKLNLKFDIADVYVSNRTSRYYDSYSKAMYDDSGALYYQTGSEALMLEVMAYLEPLMDLSKYDVNNDGVIDAVYLIYSADVEYYDSDSIYWAYVAYYLASKENNKTFDGLDVYYYLFAGFDFMDEDIDEWFKNGSDFEVNASTYIHETGHLLGLDDYYDYYPNKGSDQGLGSADMMDSSYGDHNCYSKMMLGWIEPIVVTEDKTITIRSFESSGDFIMLLLDYDGTYFSEYILIDLYSATGLNKLHSELETSNIYGGIDKGVRIYHVDSSVNEPFSDDYYSVTDNNNSLTKNPLIKLIEADGEKNFNGSYGEATASDLWMKGMRFSDVYSKYVSYNYELIWFDIIIEDLTADGAVIRIDYK